MNGNHKGDEMEIGYAYATSEIANHFGHDDGCAYLAETKNGRRERIVHTFDDRDNKALEHAMKWARMNGVEIEPISKDWAERIVTIRSYQR